ncbi:MAG: M24 family metallopeptidase [Actinomycetota bacterium]
MTTFLLHDNAGRSPEMRHEIAEPIMDPITFIEHDGRRIVVGTWLEKQVFEMREDVADEFWDAGDLGSEELIRDRNFPEHLINSEIVRRALERAGAKSVVIPPTFRVLVADYLRGEGIEVVVDTESWESRRRRKAPWEIEGIERAQRAAETAMLVAARLLREAEPASGGRLRFEGEILTAEFIRELMADALVSQGAECEEIIVHSGDAFTGGHEIGIGPILPDRSCIIDCFPRDRRTGCHSDMTRTFVPGQASDEMVRLHKHCLEALEIARDAIKPGRDDAHQRVVDYFHSQGLPTRDHYTGEGPLLEGFPHSLGHGVGLEVHEKPWLGRRPDAVVEGDVVAIEPGLYFKGVGGVRLEDTVVVTDGGIEYITDPFPYELEP